MKTDLVQIAFLSAALVLAAAFQDMSPTFGGVKPPFLQVLALYVSLTAVGKTRRGRDGTRPSSRWIWTACAAGYLMETLSGLPIGCCVGFLLPACAVARALRRALAEDLSLTALGLMAAMSFAPLQEAWLDAWGVTGGGSSFLRFFASALPAAATGATLFYILPKIERFAGLKAEVDT